MDFYIQQVIHIHSIRIGGITNSSVLQIGSAGVIKPSSYLYNTGGFIQAAPLPAAPQAATAPTLLAPAVPLHAPVRGKEKRR